MWYVVMGLVASLKDDVQLIKTVNFKAFVLFIRILTYIQHESIRDKHKTLTIKEYLDMIRPYLSDIITDHKTQGE